jgi:serine/threonine protein kinase/Leucine-rich repeat (LRR) protein
MIPCFTEVELRAYLSGDLPAERQAGASDHLRTCATCQLLWDEVRGGYSGASLSPHHLPTRLELTKHGDDSFDANHPDLPDHELNLASAASPPASLTISEFLHSLSESGLLLPAEIDQVREESAADRVAGSTVADLINWLIKQDKLTRYQAELLCRGRAGGLVLGNYIILDKIGQGGMGTVFKARHRRMNRLVALKVLPTSLSKIPEAIARFQREVEAAARLHHPHVAAAYDADEAEGVHFLVMEYVDGPNLASYVRDRGPLPPPAAVRLIAQAARGLAAAHAMGIVHRDIKPSNLMVNRQGALKVLDMGLAQMKGGTVPVDLTTDVTQTGRTMGTVDYMAPEQARDAKSVDARADIYSLGCTLYFLLVGHTPAPPGSAAEKLLWHQTAEPAPLIDVSPGVTARLEALVRQMMAKVPTARPQSMADVALELDECLAEMPGLPADLAVEGIEIPPSEPPSTVRGSKAGRGTMMEMGDTLLSKSRLAALAAAPPTRAQIRGRLVAFAAGAIGVAALAALFLAPLVSAWNRSPPSPPTDGLLIVHVDQGPAAVIVNGRFRGTAGKAGQPLELRLAPGSQFVEIKREGFLPHEERIETAANATTRVVASLQRTEPLPAPVVPRPGVSPHAKYQNLLTWVWRHRGSVAAVIGDGTQVSLESQADLPDVPVEIAAIRLDGSGVQDKELAILAAAPRLRELWLSNTTISDEGLIHLAKLDQMTRLHLAGTAIKGPGLASLSRMSRLVELDLSHTPLTDQALARLAPLTKLQRLDLSDTAVTDLGIEQLRPLKSLEVLVLHNTGLSQSLHAALTGENQALDVQWDGADQQRAVAGRLLDAGATLTVADGNGQLIADVRDRNALPPGRVAVKKVDFSTGATFADDDLKQLVALPEIESLDLVNVNLSPAGLAHVQGLATLRRVQLAAHRLPATAVAAFQQALPNCEVSLKEPVDIEVAQAVVALGGRVTIVTEQGPLEVTEARMLPAGMYSLRAINLAGAERLNPELLVKLHELPTLETLSLADTPLTDEDLRQLAGCKSLRDLTLSGTKITSAGIASLAKLPSLVRLYVARTPIGEAGVRQACNLPRLTHLSLQQVALTDDDLPLLKRLKELQWLDLSATPVSDAALTHLAELAALTRLDVRSTQLTDAGLEELRSAIGTRCEISGDVPDPQRAAARWLVQHKATVRLESGPLVGLKSLPRDACRVVSIDLAGLDNLHADDIVKHVSACTDVHSLDLSKTGVGDADLALLARLPKLTTLRLAGVSISDRALKALAGLTALETLDLRSTRITGAGLGELSAAKELKHLYLSHAPVRAESLDALAAFPQLQTLDISATAAIDDAGLAHLETLQGLRSLGLRSAKITDASLERLARLTALESLDLEGTPITDEGVEKLVPLPRLAKLSLNRTGVSDGVTTILAQMKSLRSVALLGTPVTPESIRTLRAALPSGAEILAPTPRQPAGEGVPAGERSPLNYTSGTGVPLARP